MKSSSLKPPRRVFWLDEKIAEAEAKYFGPSHLGWLEFEVARDAREKIEETGASRQNYYSYALLCRAQVLALVRCQLLWRGIEVESSDLAISDWATARKVPALDAFLNEISAGDLAHIEAILGAHPEPCLIGLNSKQRRTLAKSLQTLAATLAKPLISELAVVRRLKAVRYICIAIAAALALLALCVAFGLFADKAGKRNLALNRPVTVSSQIEGVGEDHRLLVDGNRTNLGFHTDVLPNQSVVIDLGSSLRFDKVVVYNRADCCQDRTVPLVLEVSDDGNKYEQLGQRDVVFNRWTVSRLRAKGRYVRLRLLSTNCFHLSEVEVY